MVRLPVFGIFNERKDVDVYMPLHAGDVRTPVRESALDLSSLSLSLFFFFFFFFPLRYKLTLREKSLAAPWTRTRVSIAPGFSFGRSTN